MDSAKKNTYTDDISVRSPSWGRNKEKWASPAQKTTSLDQNQMAEVEL